LSKICGGIYLPMKPVRKKKSIHPILDELASTYIYIAYRLYIEKRKGTGNGEKKNELLGLN